MFKPNGKQDAATKGNPSKLSTYIVPKPDRRFSSILKLQNTLGNQAVQGILQNQERNEDTSKLVQEPLDFRHDLSRIPVYLRSNSASKNLTINRPGDRYEQEADQVAEQVMSLGQSRQSDQQNVSHHKTESVRGSGSDNPSRGNALSSETRRFFEQRFGQDFANVRVHSGRSANESARSLGARAYTVGADISFASGEYQPSTQRGRQLLAHELAHVVQQSSVPKHIRSHDLAASLSPISSSDTLIQRDVSGDSDRLLEYERRRSGGEAVTEIEQRTAEQEALSSSQQALSVARDAVGSEIANVQTRILEQINLIEGARSDGYIQAITELNARGLDNDADYAEFGIAMGGNLLWALSGIVPMVPVAAFTIRGLGPFFSFVCRSREVWTASVGVVGAMSSQFSSGLPSGTSSANVKSAMIRRLTTANSELCNHLRRRFYVLLTGAIAHASPEASTDAQEYAAELEVGLSHALYGDIYAKHLNDGDLVRHSAVKDDARNQLLRQYVAGSSAIETHFVGSNDIGPTRSASEANVIDDAITLLGGQNALQFKPYELVVNQARTSAQDLGVTLPNVDTRQMARVFSRNRDFFIPATRWDPTAIFSGNPNRWMNPLHTSSIVECHPRITNEPYMQERHIRSIDGVTLRSSQMTSLVESHGRRIWSMNEVWFQVHGGPDDTSGFIQVTGIPGTFFIKYQVQD